MLLLTRNRNRVLLQYSAKLREVGSYIGDQKSDLSTTHKIFTTRRGQKPVAGKRTIPQIWNRYGSKQTRLRKFPILGSSQRCHETFHAVISVTERLYPLRGECAELRTSWWHEVVHIENRIKTKAENKMLQYTSG